jgi:hypothetical protein
MTTQSAGAKSAIAIVSQSHLQVSAALAQLDLLASSLERLRPEARRQLMDCIHQHLGGRPDTFEVVLLNSIQQLHQADVLLGTWTQEGAA